MACLRCTSLHLLVVLFSSLTKLEIAGSPDGRCSVASYDIWLFAEYRSYYTAYFTQLEYFELDGFLIHFVLAAIIFFICGLWAYQLNKYSEQQFTQTLEMGRLQHKAVLADAEREQQEALAESNRRFTYAAKATSDAIWDRTTHLIKSSGATVSISCSATRSIRKQNRSISGDRRYTRMILVLFQTPYKRQKITRKQIHGSANTVSKANGDYAYVREKAIIFVMKPASGTHHRRPAGYYRDQRE